VPADPKPILMGGTMGAVVERPMVAVSAPMPTPHPSADDGGFPKAKHREKVLPHAP
jgi:hypothetical protein